MSEEPGTPARRSRTAQQEETRRDLVLSALAHFTRDGYAGASLEKIAADAGYTKGAVYSNFSGKAELFLAVMDHNLGHFDESTWDPLAHPGTHGVQDPTSPYGSLPDEPTPEEATRAFGLATLEFIGSTGRDDVMREAIAQRLDVLVRVFTGFVAARRPPEEHVPPAEIAKLLAALDQGAAVLGLGGIEIDPGLVRTGLHRIMDPAAAAATVIDPGGDPRPPSMNDLGRVRTLIEEVRTVDEQREAQQSDQQDGPTGEHADGQQYGPTGEGKS
ncbi:MAG: TetR/AcrR family transcriptional regulator [Actinomycetaceae bacterium]